MQILYERRRKRGIVIHPEDDDDRCDPRDGAGHAEPAAHDISRLFHILELMVYVQTGFPLVNSLAYLKRLDVVAGVLELK